MTKLLINGKLVYAVSIKRNDVIISKETVQARIKERPKIEVFARVYNQFETKLNGRNLSLINKHESLTFYVKKSQVKDIKPYDQIEKFSEDILNAIRAEMLRIGRPILATELGDTLRLNYLNQKVSEDECLIEGLVLGDRNLVCIFKKEKLDLLDFTSAKANEKLKILKILSTIS